MIRIGDRVLVTSCKIKNHQVKGRVIDMKWNLVLIQFEDGERDWVDAKWVKHQ